MEEILKALEGITYSDWVKIRMGVDRYFEKEKSESARNIKLADSQEVSMFIRSQFG